MVGSAGIVGSVRRRGKTRMSRRLVGLSWCFGLFVLDADKGGDPHALESLNFAVSSPLVSDSLYSWVDVDWSVYGADDFEGGLHALLFFAVCVLSWFKSLVFSVQEQGKKLVSLGVSHLVAANAVLADGKEHVAVLRDRP